MVDQNFLLFLVVKIHKAWNFADRKTHTTAMAFSLIHTRIVINSLCKIFPQRKTVCLYCICCIWVYSWQERTLFSQGIDENQISHLQFYISDWRIFCWPASASIYFKLCFLGFFLNLTILPVPGAIWHIYVLIWSWASHVWVMIPHLRVHMVGSKSIPRNSYCAGWVVKFMNTSHKP